MHDESRRVFLSASIPLPGRHPKYLETADPVAVRDAVRALTIVIAQGDLELVFGGHPAITPMVRLQLLAAGKRPGDQFVVYQSAYFKSEYPDDNESFERVIEVDSVEQSLEKSISAMRNAMMAGDFCCGIFIGGMDGVESEYSMFRERHPDVPAFPVGSTGAGAAFILAREEATRPYYDRLKSDYRYLSLMRELLRR